MLPFQFVPAAHVTDCKMECEYADHLVSRTYSRRRVPRVPSRAPQPERPVLAMGLAACLSATLPSALFDGKRWRHHERNSLGSLVGQRRNLSGHRADKVPRRLPVVRRPPGSKRPTGKPSVGYMGHRVQHHRTTASSGIGHAFRASSNIAPSRVEVTCSKASMPRSRAGCRWSRGRGRPGHRR